MRTGPEPATAEDEPGGAGISPPATASAFSWPPAAGRCNGLRIIGDVHGEAAQFAAACDTAEGRFILQLGDLTDQGPDSPAVLRRSFALLDSGAGLFLLGNHDHRLRRALLGRSVARTHGLAETLAQLAAAPDGEALANRAIAEIARAPAWLRAGNALFVHAALHPRMAWHAPPAQAGARRPDALTARALYGEVLPGLREDGYPNRSIDWVNDIPMGLTAYVGHDIRSRDGKPWLHEGRAGGRALFLDTGAGKGGHLSWIDLPQP